MPSYGSSSPRDPRAGSSGGNRDSLEERRERALEGLTAAFAEDRISLEDYESRAGAVQRARDLAELEAFVDDLPLPSAESPQRAPASRERDPDRRSAAPFAPFAPFPPFAPRPPEAPQAPFSPAVDPALSGRVSLACVMGERHLQGDWLTGDRVESFTLMGSTKIDLRDSPLPAGRLRVEAFVLMGDIKIIVPRGLPVRLDVFPFMGEAKVARDVSQRVDASAPHLVVEGFVMMGSLSVVAMD